MKRFSFLLMAIIVAFGATSCMSAKTDTSTDPSGSKVSPTKEPAQPENIEQTVTFYYSDEAVMYLVPQTNTITTTKDELYDRIISTLVQGPSSDTLMPTITGDVKLISSDLKDGVCTIDLSSEFNENSGGSTKETMAVYSIVNTLCSIDGIDAVKINIDGNKNPAFGSFDLKEPIEPNWDLIQKAE